MKYKSVTCTAWVPRIEKNYTPDKVSNVCLHFIATSMLNDFIIKNFFQIALDAESLQEIINQTKEAE